MTVFVQLLLLGLATGGFYAINALGIVVVFRSSGVVNFAAGGAAMVGGYLSWWFADVHGLPHLVALPLAVLASALVGLAVFGVAIAPLSSASVLAQVIATLAALVIIQQAVVLWFGGLPKLPEPFLPTRAVHLGAVSIGADSLLILLCTLVLTAALWAFYRYTRFGIATSALAEAPRSLAALGWRVSALRAANWAVGGALAGVAGAGLGPLLQLNTVNFTAMLVPTLAAAVVGGMRSFPGTLAGGLLMGAAQALATNYVHVTGIADAVPLVVVLLVFVLRGEAIPARDHVQERLPRAGSGRVRVVPLLVFVLVAGFLATRVDLDWVGGATTTLIVGVLLLSQVVITGYAGQLSLGQLAIAGVGAICSAHFASVHGVPFLVSLLVGMAVAVPVSFILGLAALRSRGVSLAVATLAFSVAVNSLVLGNPHANGGVLGLPLDEQTLFGWSIDATFHPVRYFWVSLGVFLLLALVVANLRRGRTGRRMLALRTNERAAAALGIDAAAVKLYAFCVAGSIAGAAGVLTAFAVTLPQFTSYDTGTALNDVVAMVLGGVGFLAGAVLGGLFAPTGLPSAIAYPWTSQWATWNSVLPLLIGAVLIFQLITNPDGLAEGAGKAIARLRRPLARRTLGRPVARTERELAQARTMQHRWVGSELTVHDVRVAFGPVVAVDGVSFSVARGEVLSVIGPNGAGKTTLMDAVTGFVAMSGRVEIDGRAVHTMRAHRRSRAGLTRSFQSLELLEDMSVLDNLRCAADAQDWRSYLVDLVRPDRSGITPAMAAAIDAFELSDKLELLPTEIAYGDRRLVAIARAVAAEPAVLLLDEPAAGLSQRERHEVARLISLMAKEWGIAIVLIEHDVELVRRVSDRVIALDFGRQIAGGSPDEVLSDPAVVDAYLGREPDEEPVTADLAAGREEGS